MTTITILRDHNQNYKGFTCSGHSGFADAGEDIVCAGISVLVINTINSISCFTRDKFETESDEETGEIQFHFQEIPCKDAELLISSMVLGLQGIQNNYGNEYIILNFEEV